MECEVLMKHEIYIVGMYKIIKESYSTYLKSEKKKKDQKDILYLDYSCKKIYKQYVVV